MRMRSPGALRCMRRSDDALGIIPIFAGLPGPA
jgi:hypothetical protein